MACREVPHPLTGTLHLLRIRTAPPLMKADIHDLLVIGAGPAGLATGIEARRAGLRYLILDKGSVVHNIGLFQRDMYFFSTAELLEIGDVPFVVPTARPTSLDCVNYYRRVADHHSLQCRFYCRVVSISRVDGLFRVGTEGGGEFRSKNVVLATGYYDTPKTLNVPGESPPHVSPYYRDALPYYRQKVLIVGGKNSAVEAALDLWRHGADVTVAHRGEALSSGVKYWILPDFENRVKDGSIKLMLRTTVAEFREGSVLLSPGSGEKKEVGADFVFTLIGYRADTAFLRACGVGLDPETEGPVYNTETMETNVPGLYVAGGMVGGNFNNRVFIENGRRHGAQIVGAITGGRGTGMV